MNSRIFEEVQRGEGINKDNNPEKIGGVQSEWSWHAFSPSPCVEFRGAGGCPTARPRPCEQ